MTTPIHYAYDVFLSYSSADKVQVRRLARRLQASGLRVWFDEWTIKPGDDIYLAVERGLESSRTLVLCMSPATFSSNWTALERSTVLFRDPSNVGRRFIPVLLADCTIPDALRRFKHIDYHNEGRAALAQLVIACEQISLSRAPAQQVALKQQVAVQFERRLLGHSGWVWDVAVSPDGKWAASGSADSTVRMWDLETGTCLGTLRGHCGDVNCVAISPDGSRVLSASDDHTIRVWNASTQRLIRTLEAADSRILAAVSDSGDQILSAGPAYSVRVWHLRSGRSGKVLKGHTDEVWALDIAKDAKRALSGGFDFDIRYWNLVNGRCLKVLSGHSNVVNSVQFASDGRIAVSGSDDRTVRIWDLRRGECVRTLNGHLRTVYSVAVAPRGNIVASTGFLDETVRLWDWRSGNCVYVLQNADRASPVSVVFTRDGRRLVVGTATPDAVYVYSLPLISSAQ